MCMKSEIKGVKRVERDGKVCALILCDPRAVIERVNFAQLTSSIEGECEIVLHPLQGSTVWLNWNFTGDMVGLTSEGWEMNVDLEGLLICKNPDWIIDEEEASIDMEHEWIDVLVIVRNFFALGRAEQPDYERYL